LAGGGLIAVSKTPHGGGPEGAPVLA
jgi:hypothetical protein